MVPEHHGALTPRWRRSIAAAWLPAALGLVGIVFANHPMLFSGFRRVQIRHEDPRLINYLLEHGYLWLRGHALHRDLWSPPFFYPARGVLAYSDTLLGTAPLYWSLRLAQIPPDTAFQLWLMACFAINYLAFFILLRQAFSLGRGPSALGAFLFAFAAPRVSDVGHPQLLPHFFSIVAILAVSRILDGRRRTWWARAALWTAAGLAVVAQFYASVYMGWFLIFGGTVALLIGLMDRSCRRALMTVVGRDALVLVVTAILPIVLIAPLALRYLEVVGLVGYRDMFEIALAAPALTAWIYMGPESWLYAWQQPRLGLIPIGYIEPAERIGLGLATPLVCLYGLWLGWDRPAVRVLGFTAMTLALLVTPLWRELILGAALAEWAYLVLHFWEHRDRPGAYPVHLVLLAVLSLLLYPMITLLTASLAMGIGMTISLVAPRRTAQLAIALTWTTVLLFLVGPTFHPSPTVPVWAAALLGVALLARRLGVISLGRYGFPALVIATSIVLILVPGILNLWRLVHAYVPGAAAIRVPSRVILLILIPMAIGFAIAWESLPRRWGWKYAAPLVLLCLLEQGVTTTTFDKLEARRRAGAIAAVVAAAGPPRTFFYSSSRKGLPDWNDHVDGMWAEVVSGVPTINGYSGVSPPGWGPLYKAAVRNARDQGRVHLQLLGWLRQNNLAPEEVAWIHEGRRLPLDLPGVPASEPTSPGPASDPTEKGLTGP
jgi:hypothetical protein